jgi:hypothetical protein
MIESRQPVCIGIVPVKRIFRRKSERRVLMSTCQVNRRRGIFFGVPNGIEITVEEVSVGSFPDFCSHIPGTSHKWKSHRSLLLMHPMEAIPIPIWKSYIVACATEYVSSSIMDSPIDEPSV